MATLQDDIGSGIETIMQTSAFDTWLPSDRVQSGSMWRDVADLGKYGRALVRVLGASGVEGQLFDTSQLVDFAYEVIFEYEAFEGTAELATGFMNVMRQKFGDGGRTLEQNITDSSSKWLGKSCTCLLGEPIFEDALESENPLNQNRIRLRFPLTVRVWQSLA